MSRPSADRQYADDNDDRYRELAPVAAVREPPARRRFTRSPMFACIGKQDSEENPIVDGITAYRNTSQVRSGALKQDYEGNVWC